MQINYTGHGIEVTPALRNVIDKKFNKIVRHYASVITSINVILSVEKVNHIVEANVGIKGAEINAKATEEEMYKAIDQMIDKLDTQLIKHKEKHADH